MQQRGQQRVTDDEKASFSDDPYGVLSYLLAGILFYGGLGWAGWHFLHHLWMLPVGLILGFSASMYLIYKRYGTYR